MGNRQNQIILFLLFCIGLQTINPYAKITLGFTAMWWLVDGLVIYAFLVKSKNSTIFNKQNYALIFLYLIWNIFCVIRGFLVAEDYWEWKNLFNTSFVLLLPLSVYVSNDRILMQKIFTIFIKFLLPLFFLFSLIISKGAYGRYLIPVSILLLFVPLLNNKWRVFILLFSILAVFSSLAARSNVIKFTIPFILGLLYYARPLINGNTLKYTRVLLLIAPIIFFYLGVSNKFNIFKISDYIKGDYVTANDAEGKEEDLKADTRTALYQEVLLSAIVNDYVILGRTPARGNDSKLFGKKIEAITGSGKEERFINEVSILNVFTWTGLVGVILYFLIFIKATYLALYKSKSWFMKIIGVYLSFRWAYAWVEDFSKFDFSYVFLWLFIGVAYSSSFRTMTDLEMKYWVRGIFDIRYRKATLKKVKIIKQYI
ncbi:hypothetical protein [Croceivirga sp. JEA036]|uniref:hypothetical protein n=1 Tax=Croceivirga sp. JEA036 TaxID=2721162 RepID=UPI00143B2053|nr:hypothetical protein [Croceivirga sp. JEA036]NJB35392.1 hypothetical protein [Croceivirga sp. JEA036]